MYYLRLVNRLFVCKYISFLIKQAILRIYFYINKQIEEIIFKLPPLLCHKKVYFGAFK